MRRRSSRASSLAHRIATVNCTVPIFKASSGRMATPIAVSIPHELGRAEARRRIETGFAKIVHLLPGGTGRCSERWDGDQLTFSVATMGQTIAGVINVLDTAVNMEIELPGVLGMIASSLRGRLQEVGQVLLTKE